MNRSDFSEPSVEYYNKIDSLLIGQDRYQYAIQIRPSFSPESCLFYSPKGKELVLRVAKKNIWCADEQIKVREYRCPITSELSDKLDSLFSSAVSTSSSKAKTIGLDGTVYEIRTNWGKSCAYTWSPRDDGSNCTRLVQILKELCESIKDKDIDKVVGIIPEIDALTINFASLPNRKDEVHHGILIKSFDKAKEYPDEGQIPIDFQEYTFLNADGELGSHDNILLLPEAHLYDLLSLKVEIPADWLEQRRSISFWFSNTPSVPSSKLDRLEKRVSVYFDVIRVDEAAVGKDLYRMLVSDYSSSETNMKHANVFIVTNLRKAEYEVTP